MRITSVSTALNQNESVKAKDKLPTNAAPKIAVFCPFEDSVLFLTNLFDKQYNGPKHE